jgi:5-methyltetrahydropteroyltriglutamate--homocysteine methyltransferase
MLQVPEISKETSPKLDSASLVAKIKRAQQALGKEVAVPMIIGPITMARLATLTNTTIPEVVNKLMPVYKQLLQELAALGV